MAHFLSSTTYTNLSTTTEEKIEIIFIKWLTLKRRGKILILTVGQGVQSNDPKVEEIENGYLSNARS